MKTPKEAIQGARALCRGTIGTARLMGKAFLSPDVRRSTGKTFDIKLAKIRALAAGDTSTLPRGVWGDSPDALAALVSEVRRQVPRLNRAFDSILSNRFHSFEEIKTQ